MKISPYVLKTKGCISQHKKMKIRPFVLRGTNYLLPILSFVYEIGISITSNTKDKLSDIKNIDGFQIIEAQ